MNSLNYKDFSNEEIASVVGYAISDDCEKACRRFEEEFGKEAPPSRTVRDWKKRFLTNLSILPRSHGGNQDNRKLPNDLKQELQFITQMLLRNC